MVSATTESVLAPDQASRLRALMSAEAAAMVRESEGGGGNGAPRVRRCRVVAVGSGKGGVGKTSISVNLCISLARTGARVTLLDADIGTANADVLCGLMPVGRLEQSIVSPNGRAPRPLAELAVDAPGGFRLVPGTAGLARFTDLSAVQRAALVDQLAGLEATTDVVVVDTAAGVGATVTEFLAAADLALIVATPEPTALADAYALIKCLAARVGSGGGGGTDQARGIGNARLIVNEAASPAEVESVHGRLSAVCERFLGCSIPLAGSIALDPRVSMAVRRRRPLLLEPEGSPAARDMVTLGGSVGTALGLSAPKIRSAPGRVSGFLARLRRL